MRVVPSTEFIGFPNEDGGFKCRRITSSGTVQELYFEPDHTVGGVQIAVFDGDRATAFMRLGLDDDCDELLTRMMETVAAARARRDKGL